MNQKFQALFSELADFSNLKENYRESIPLEQKSMNRISQPSDQIDFNNNSKLLSQFKSMKDKIRVLTKENSDYKTTFSNIYKQIESKFINQIMSLQQKDVQNTAALNFLKKEMEQINLGIDEMKTKNNELQRQLNEKKNVEKELQFFQNSIVQIKQSNQDLKKENEKINEISIMQKIDLEQKIKHLNLMKQVDKEYVQQLEVELNKTREKCLNIESKYRKILNQYEESRYDREKITEYSLKEQDLEFTINELKKEKNTLKNLLTQQKQRRLKVEEKMMEKEQFSSLYSIQIQTLQRELNHLKKKNKKLSSKCEEKDAKAQKQAYKNIQSKSKLYKSIQITEQFFGRIKRELTLPHDLLQFLKSCEFKISKLKQEEERQRGGSESRSKSKKKILEKSPSKSSFKKSIHQKLKNTYEQEEEPKKVQDVQTYFTPRYLNQIIKDRNTPLKDSKFSQDTYDMSNFQRNQEILTTKSLKTAGDDGGVQKKVKRQRQEKQRKIRQNILYKKLQASNNDKEKYMIREELVKLNKDQH